MSIFETGALIICILSVIIFCVMACLASCFNVDPEEYPGFYYVKRYNNNLGEKWLNYNLTPKEAKAIVKYIEYYCSWIWKPWEHNDKFTIEHFDYLFKLISLDKNKKELMKDLRQYSFHFDELNFNYGLKKYVETTFR